MMFYKYAKYNELYLNDFFYRIFEGDEINI